MSTRGNRAYQNLQHQGPNPGRGRVLARLHALAGMPLVGVLVLCMVAACIRQGRGETTPPAPVPTASHGDTTQEDDEASEQQRENEPGLRKTEEILTGASNASTSSTPAAPPSEDQKNDRLYPSVA